MIFTFLAIFDLILFKYKKCVKLIKLYNFEKNKPNDFYEKKPEEISYIVSMSYFTLMIFLLNKISENMDQDLSQILGGLFCTLLQIFMNTQFLLYITKSETKSIMIKNRRKNFLNTKQEKENSSSNILFLANSNNKSSNAKNINNSEEDDDFFNPELNFKSVIQKYKFKLSLNNLIFAKNSFNSKGKKSGRLFSQNSTKALLNKSLNTDFFFSEINFYIFTYEKKT